MLTQITGKNSDLRRVFIIEVDGIKRISLKKREAIKDWKRLCKLVSRSDDKSDKD